MKLNTDTFKIGIWIHDMLDYTIRTFPIVAEKGTDYPFCIYRRTGTRSKDTKDIYNVEEVISLELVVCAKSYAESIDYAQKIKDRLEGLRCKFGRSKITDISLVGSNEDWASDSYIQRMNFEITIDNNEIFHK